MLKNIGMYESSVAGNRYVVQIQSESYKGHKVRTYHMALLLDIGNGYLVCPWSGVTQASGTKPHKKEVDRILSMINAVLHRKHGDVDVRWSSVK